MDRELWDAGYYPGNSTAVKEILRKNPSLNINWSNTMWSNTSHLHQACERGFSESVSILLAHPDIDVNLKDVNGWTPFMYACSHYRSSCVRVLLGDARVRPNEPNKYGSTPLRLAADGRLEVIKWWIASGREIDFGKPDDWKTMPSERPRGKDRPKWPRCWRESKVIPPRPGLR